MNTSKIARTFRAFNIQVMNPQTKETITRTLHGYSQEDVVRYARKEMPDYSVCVSAVDVVQKILGGV